MTMTRFEKLMLETAEVLNDRNNRPSEDTQMAMHRARRMAIESLMVPDSERVIGKMYLEQCGHMHKWKGPRKSWAEAEKEILSKLSTEIAKEIDDEVLRDLMKGL
jgi:hypothetical protein